MAEDNKLVQERYKFAAQREKETLEDILAKLEQAVEYSDAGNEDEAEAIRQGLLDSLDNQIKQYEQKECVTKNQGNILGIAELGICQAIGGKLR
jgi:vacuolar-type H+-ATPase subunit H